MEELKEKRRRDTSIEFNSTESNENLAESSEDEDEEDGDDVSELKMVENEVIF